MVYVYRRKASESARDLAEAMTVNCRRLTDLAKAHFGNGVRAGDTVICWGEQLAPIEGVRILNGAVLTNKMQDAQRLRAAGVPTVEVSPIRPPDVPANDSFDFRETNGRMTRADVRALVTRLNTFLATPVAVPITWLARRFNHQGGTDLLHPPAQPDYFSKRENLVTEYRIHLFNGKSLRAGTKVPRDAGIPHDWIRSHDGGWKISYDGFASKKKQRAIAIAAVEALGLQFGAVHIGEKADGSLIVLEVNRAPGLEGNTTTAYAKAVQEWLAEG